MIPKDPVILLSYVNTQLRDYYDSLEALCTCRGLKKQELVEKLRTIDYEYDEIQTSYMMESGEDFLIKEIFLRLFFLKNIHIVQRIKK